MVKKNLDLQYYFKLIYNKLKILNIIKIAINK